MTDTNRARYGSHRGNSMAGKIIAIGLVIFVLAVVVIVFQQNRHAAAVSISASEAGYDRTDDHTLRMNVDVSRSDVDKPGYCIVTALNYAQTEIGRREFLVPSGGPKTQRMTVTIPTGDVPVAGKVYGCANEIPSYLTKPAH